MAQRWTIVTDDGADVQVVSGQLITQDVHPLSDRTAHQEAKRDRYADRRAAYRQRIDELKAQLDLIGGYDAQQLRDLLADHIAPNLVRTMVALVYVGDLVVGVDRDAGPDQIPDPTPPPAPQDP